MTPVLALLGSARKRLLRDRAVMWGAGGAAVAAVLVLAVEIAYRRWPQDPAWPALAAAAFAGVIVAVVGWTLNWPSWREVAQTADARLGGRERLTTALQFVTESGGLYERQRYDAASFALAADIASLGSPRVPLKTLALAAECGAVGRRPTVPIRI